MLNGAEGMGQLFNQVLGMGAAAIPMLRDMLADGNGNGSSAGRPAPARTPPPPSTRRRAAEIEQARVRSKESTQDALEAG